MIKRITCKSQSYYDFYINRQIAPYVLVIRDLDVQLPDMAPLTHGPYKSVTNNIEAVLKEIERHTSEELAVLPIIYRDSEFHYDGIMFMGGSIMAYNLIPGKRIDDEDEALRAVRDFYRTQAERLLSKG